jgi:hypothetical protein
MTMGSDKHTYPPSLDDALKALDPHLLATLEGVVRSKMDETEQAYRLEIQARDEALQKHEQERQVREAALQAQLQELASELIAVKMQTG